MHAFTATNDRQRDALRAKGVTWNPSLGAWVARDLPPRGLRALKRKGLTPKAVPAPVPTQDGPVKPTLPAWIKWVMFAPPVALLTALIVIVGFNEDIIAWIVASAVWVLVSMVVSTLAHVLYRGLRYGDWTSVYDPEMTAQARKSRVHVRSYQPDNDIYFDPGYSSLSCNIYNRNNH